MLISDWSSDVCSSDLRLRRLARAEGLPETAEQAGARLYVNLAYVFDPVWLRHIVTLPGTVVMDGGNLVMAHLTGGMTPADIPEHQGALTIIDYQDNPQIYNRQLRKLDRSEEHTSELQSLMRSTYAVLCLKHKNIYYNAQIILYQQAKCRQ